MQRLRKLFDHDLYGPTIRYGMAGSLVAVVYISLPLLLKSALHMPIAAAIGIGYLVAVVLHFNLQRHFVFRHVKHAFELSRSQQIVRYIVMGAIQYPLTLASTSLLPHALDVPQRDVYVATVIVIAVAGFIVLRLAIFHPSGDPREPQIRV